MFWRLKTAMMFAFMTLILAGIGSAIGYFFNNIWTGFYVMIGISIVFSFISYFYSKPMALKANGARIITQEEEPRLWRIVSDVAMKANVPMPEVGIVETPMPNAFATGRGPKNAAVVATTGLLAMLPDDELEGVIAHEMSHVKNRDILVMSVAATMAAVISYLARMATMMAIFGNNDNRNPAAFAILILLEITIPIAAILVQLGVSRNREYLADATGAKITKNPRALARALAHISEGPKVEYDNTTYAHMWIENPNQSGMSLTQKLFSTHPPTSERIRRLEEMDGKI